MVDSCCSFVSLERRILYIVNPIAGTGSRTSLTEQIRKLTSAAGIPFEITDSVKDGNYEAMAVKVIQENFTDLVIAGGDGTVSQAIAGLRYTGAKFGILPSGSGNGLARAAGIPLSTSKALDLIFKGEAKHTDGMLVNGKFACMLCGLGFDAAVAHSFAKQPSRGLTTYTKETIRQLSQATSYHFRIHNEHHTLETDCLMISVANANQYGNNVTIAPKAKLDDGLLDVVILTAQSKVSMLVNTLQQLFGARAVTLPQTSNPNQKLLYWQVKHIRIENKSGAPLHIDGDPASNAEEVTFEIFPQAFFLIR